MNNITEYTLIPLQDGRIMDIASFKLRLRRNTRKEIVGLYEAEKLFSDLISEKYIVFCHEDGNETKTLSRFAYVKLSNRMPNTNKLSNQFLLDCKVCGKQFLPDPRTINKQKTCGSRECIIYYKNHKHELTQQNKIKEPWTTPAIKETEKDLEYYKRKRPIHSDRRT